MLRSTKEREALRVAGKCKLGSRRILKPKFSGQLDQQCPNLTLLANNHICYRGDSSSNHYSLHPYWDRGGPER